jgi:IBR domain, a half RING-finger domain
MDTSLTASIDSLQSIVSSEGELEAAQSLRRIRSDGHLLTVPISAGGLRATPQADSSSSPLDPVNLISGTGKMHPPPGNLANAMPPLLNAKCAWPDSNVLPCTDTMDSAPMKEYRKMMATVSSMCKQLGEIERCILCHRYCLCLEQVPASDLESWRSKAITFDNDFADFAIFTSISNTSGLSTMINMPTSNLPDILKEVFRLLRVIRQQTSKYFFDGMTIQKLGRIPQRDEWTVQGISDEISVKPTADDSSQVQSVEEYYTQHFPGLLDTGPPYYTVILTTGRVRSIKTTDLIIQHGCNYDLINFGIFDNHTPHPNPVRWTSATGPGAIGKTIKFEQLQNHVHEHLRLPQDIEVEMWCFDQLITKETFDQLVFPGVHTSIMLVIDPKLTVKFQTPDNSSATLTIDFSGRFINKANASSQGIKKLIAQHVLDCSQNEPSYPEQICEVSGSTSYEIFLYCNEKPIASADIPLRDECKLPIRKCEGFEPITITASWQELKIECTVCKEMRSEADVAKANITAFCKHPSTHSCNSCLGTWLEQNFSHWKVDYMNCPVCAQAMTEEEVIAALANDEERKTRYVALIDLVKRMKDPNFVWCCRPSCDHGQIHSTQPELMTCERCDFVQCAKHNVPWHHNGTLAVDEVTGHEVSSMTCQRFETEVVVKNHAANNRATEDTVKRTTKACPNCSSRIEKSNGCDHMTCKCNAQFCWGTSLSCL